MRVRVKIGVRVRNLCSFLLFAGAESKHKTTTRAKYESQEITKPRQTKTRQDKTRARQKKTRQGQGQKGKGKARQDKKRQDKIRQD